VRISARFSIRPLALYQTTLAYPVKNSTLHIRMGAIYIVTQKN
jgi:hypothetical protein